ncbi:endonuclease/exonuclease/phosphatase family protein [Streptomyces ardesiacus]|uniref:endonuclease/exonuclease/phosphatase family protein n=1 Tax=Streptomyces ardesiacus TaxID=285564 RepID=UPI0006E3760A|nr:endonuclease/exonuclease/phosphatase family protein [Streptomyces sp. NBRC 110030]
MPPAASPPTPRRRPRPGLPALVAVLVVSGVLAVLLSPAVTHSARLRHSASTLTVATWNMCGVRQWGCADTGGAAAKRRAVERLVRAGVDVVLLQEACATHAESVRAALGGSWRLAFRPYTWRTGAGNEGRVHCEGRGLGTAGIAILSDRPLSSVRQVPSRQPVAGVRRGILCADVGAVGVRVCNAHLSLPGSDRAHPGREYRDAQLTALVAAVPGRRVVFGGDFNLNPPGARNPSSRVWPSVVYDVYRECDQSGAADRSARPTHVSGHKLDYLFTGLPVSACTLRDTGVSDHRALLMRVAVR